MRRILSIYERVLRPLAHYEPEYSLFKRSKDGELAGVPRICFHLLWSVYAAAFVALALGFSFLVTGPLALATLLAIGTGPLYVVKLWHVFAATERPRALWHQPDPLDWICDVGCCGSLGALGAAQLIGGYAVSPTSYVIIVAVYLFAYPWATP